MEWTCGAQDFCGHLDLCLLISASWRKSYNFWEYLCHTLRDDFGLGVISDPGPISGLEVISSLKASGTPPSLRIEPKPEITSSPKLLHAKNCLQVRNSFTGQNLQPIHKFGVEIFL